MTSFTLEHAHRLAGNAFRFRHERFTSPEEQEAEGLAQPPLLNKEQELFEVLTKAEELYLDWLRLLDGLRTMHEVDRTLSCNCSDLANELRDALACLSKIGELERCEFDNIVFGEGMSMERISRDLARALQCAEMAILEEDEADEDRGGRKPGIGKNGFWFVPLEEFAKTIRVYWKKATGLEFSFDAVTRHDLEPVVREPASPAARLLFYAARELDKNIELSHIEYVMKAVERNPDLRPERWDNDPKIDSVIG
jgi:hypothetical protein